jgi:CDP-glucose 4,6-dehydratase
MEDLGMNQVRGSDHWSGKSVFVTGGTGLIGSWLVKKLLAAGAQVVVLVKDINPQSEIVRSGDLNRVAITYGNLENFDAVAGAITLYDVDTVFHLGAQTQVGVAHRYPLNTFETNIRGTYNLLEACRLHRDLVKRIVIASTDKAYGEQNVLPYNETTPLDARHCYDVSKSCADLIAQAYFHTYALPLAITRCGNVYGGGDWNHNRIVPGTITSLARGRRPVIRSDGSPLRDYIYVEDVAEAYIRLAERLEDPKVAGQAFNFSHGVPVSVLQIVSTIRNLMGREDIEPLFANTARAEIQEQYLDASKAQQILGWKPQYSLIDGLKHTIDWYLNSLAGRSA